MFSYKTYCIVAGFVAVKVLICLKSAANLPEKVSLWSGLQSARALSTLYTGIKCLKEEHRAGR